LETQPDFLTLTSKTLSKIAFAAGILDGSIEELLMTYWKSELKVPESLCRNNQNVVSGDVTSKILGFFGVNKKLSHSALIPDWAHKKIKKTSSNENKLIKWYQTRPPIWIRIQTANTEELFGEFDKNGIQYSISKTIKNALCIKNAKVNLYSLESFKNGLFEIQDIASQSIGIIAGAKPEERWWDCCAGAGGKSLQLSSIMQNKGRVVASDIRKYKLDDLKKRVRRNEKSNIEYKIWDGKAVRNKKAESFDGVLIDAPCSCSGTWRRNPDARWRLTPFEVEELLSIQSSILENVSSEVRKGGILIYATCSVFNEENGQIVMEFLKYHTEFVLESFVNPLNGKSTNGMLQIYPWMADCDAMFVSKMRKSS
jgi:16S rRNA (cytosine967-C5)-methyltransferase